MPPESSKKSQNNSNNKQKQSHTRTSSASKTPNKHDSTESNEKKISTGNKNQTTRAVSQIAEKFPNSCKKHKITTQEKRDMTFNSTNSEDASSSTKSSLLIGKLRTRSRKKCGMFWSKFLDSTRKEYIVTLINAID